MKENTQKNGTRQEPYNNKKDTAGQKQISPAKKNMVTGEETDPEEGSDVSPEESKLLDQTLEHMASKDDEDQVRATLDNTDDDGEPLNEINDASGSDLDVPGAEEDDDDEAVGEEDEENNSYSLGADKKD